MLVMLFCGALGGPSLGGSAPSSHSESFEEGSAFQDLQEVDGTASYVVGGTPVAPGNWTATVGLLEQGQVRCTGTLIAPAVVLTAAHCVTDANPTQVRIGSVDSGFGGEVIAIASATVHPDYLSQYSADIAVLQLANPAMTAPVAIAADCVAVETLYDGAPVTIVGFGATDPAGQVYPGVLYEASSTIHDADCSEDVVNGIYTGCDSSVRPLGGELVAGGGGVDSCYGDSGGPLYVQAADGAWYVAGVTSRGLAGTTSCGNGGIYSRPDAWLSWMESVVGPLPRPACGVTGGDDPWDPAASDDPVEPPAEEPEEPVDESPQDEPIDEAPQPDDPLPADDPASDEPGERPGGTEGSDETGDALQLLGDRVFVERNGLVSVPLYLEGAPMSEVGFEIAVEPDHGEAIISYTGVLTYRNTSRTESDRLEVRAMDRSGRVAVAEIEIVVLERRGCSTSQHAGRRWGGYALFGRR